MIEKDKQYNIGNIEIFIIAILFDISLLIKAIISIVQDFSIEILVMYSVIILPLIIYFTIGHIKCINREIKEMKEVCKNDNN